MKRARSAALLAAPVLLCAVFYWYGVRAWFQADDFAWLGLRQDITDWPSFLSVMFGPRAQGTIRPLSERGFFLVFYSLFGLDALPYRIWVLLTQAVNLLLLSSITRRLTGSRAAGFWAAVFWTVNSSLAWVMTWTSAYNQALCAFFLLLAFHFLLRFIETGRRRYEVLQWAVFLLGFGAQELNVVYPALAAGYTLLCARKYLRRTLPLFVPSLVYTALHLHFAPKATGVYAMHFDSSIFGTLATYWAWTAGSSWLKTPWDTPEAFVIGGVVLVTVPLVGFVIWRAVRGDRLPLFFVAWFVVTLTPLLPLRDHLTEYYPYIPSIGFAMLCGFGFVAAWRRNAFFKSGAIVIALMYVGMAAPRARATCEQLYLRSRRVERVVLGVERAHQLHPYQTILLHNVDSDLFWSGVLDNPYRLFGARVLLTPGTEQRIPAQLEYGDVASCVLPAGATEKALNSDSIVVYDVSGERLKNITRLYGNLFDSSAATTPRRVDAANPLMSYLFGPAWYEISQMSRWMPRRATFRIGGPASAAQRLYVTGSCPSGLLAGGPVSLTVLVDGSPAGTARIAAESFELPFPLPPASIGRESVEITLESSRTLTPPGENRELSLIFGVFEVK